MAKKSKIVWQLTFTAIAGAVCLVVFIALLIFIHKHDVWNKDNYKIISISLSYVLCSFIACLIDSIYRFQVTADTCRTVAIIQEGWIAITRSVLLIYYVVLIDQVFNNETFRRIHGISKRIIKMLYAIIILIHMFVLPVIIILLHETYPIIVGELGIRCLNHFIHNDIAKATLIIYQSFDAAFTLGLCSIFVAKLRRMTNNITNDIQRITKMAMTLTFVSVLSSEIIICGGRLDGHKDTFWRWIYPWDYIVNCACIFIWICKMPNKPKEEDRRGEYKKEYEIKSNLSTVSEENNEMITDDLCHLSSGIVVDEGGTDTDKLNSNNMRNSLQLHQNQSNSTTTIEMTSNIPGSYPHSQLDSEKQSMNTINHK